MPILKNINPEIHFTRIPNNLLQNESLSYESKGLLFELLSRPTNWKIHKEQLLRDHTRHTKIDRIFQELQNAGYLYIETAREAGKIVDRYWVVSNKSLTIEKFKKELLALGNLDLRKPRFEETSIRANHGLQINTNKKKEKKKEDITPLLSSTELLLDKMTEKKRASIFIIFDFWNSYKSTGWSSHRKIAFDMIQAIEENLNNFTVEDICIAIDNYATILLDDKYYWDYSWPLSIFLMVKNGRYRDATKKWWQFLPDNFKACKYLKDSDSIDESAELDLDPELTKQVISVYSWLINNDKYTPTVGEMNKFIKTTIKMEEFYTKRSIIKVNWAKYLKKCLEKSYRNKGDIVYAGHLCSDHTWNILMPQYLSELGV